MTNFVFKGDKIDLSHKQTGYSFPKENHHVEKHYCILSVKCNAPLFLAKWTKLKELVEFTVRKIPDLKQFLMNAMNGRKIACDRIENVCIDVGLIAKGNAVL